MMIGKIKWVVLLLVVVLFVNASMVLGDADMTRQSDTSVVDVIPADAIRLRILANSDSIADQTLKKKIRDAVAADIAKWVENYQSKEEASAVIKTKIPEIETVIQAIMQERNQIQPFTVELTPTEFPVKIYGNQLYAAGTYDALKIVLGEGEGANWWCVLFPPLCFLDFDTSSVAENTAVEDRSEEEAVSVENTEEVKVEFFLIKWIKSLLG